MSLYKQLAIFIVLLFMIMFCGTWWVNFNSTQNFLTNQLHSQAEDSATSLGFSLSPYMQQADIASIQTTINAFFDRGYYLEITVRDSELNRLASRQQAITVKDVPAWFVKLLNIESPTAVREISTAWAISGDIIIKVHTGHAYQKLWESLKLSFIWFLVASIALIVLGFSSLRALLKPLNAVTQQADSICKNQFGLQIPLPKSKELRTVVDAMNRMTNRLKSMFKEQSQTAHYLRDQAYKDSLTGLGNYANFKTQFNSYLTESELFKPGTLFLIKINDFAGYNNRQGLQAGDEMLLAVRDILRELVSKYGDTQLSRIAGSEFAMFITGIGEEDMAKLASILITKLSQLYSSKIYDQENVCHLGTLTLDEQQDMSTALSCADHALRLAQSKGPNTWQHFENKQQAAKQIAGRHDWLKHLSKEIEENKITLLTQNAVDCHNPEKLLHQETFCQIRDNNSQICPAGIFMVSVEQLGLSQQLDRMVINKVIAYLLSLPDASDATCSINLSFNSLKDKVFTKWLLNTLKALPASSGNQARNKRIIFEFSESEVMQNLGLLKKLSEALNELGHGLGLDQFGRGFSDFSYLQSLKPSYVKIDKVYTSDIEQQTDKQFFVSTLSNICHSLDIQIIAQAVESQSQWDKLKTLHVDGVQGYAIHKPSELYNRDQQH